MFSMISTVIELNLLIYLYTIWIYMCTCLYIYMSELYIIYVSLTDIMFHNLFICLLPMVILHLFLYLLSSLLFFLKILYAWVFCLHMCLYTTCMPSELKDSCKVDFIHNFSFYYPSIGIKVWRGNKEVNFRELLAPIECSPCYWHFSMVHKKSHDYLQPIGWELKSYGQIAYESVITHRSYKASMHLWRC